MAGELTVFYIISVMLSVLMQSQCNFVEKSHAKRGLMESLKAVDSAKQDGTFASIFSSVEREYIDFICNIYCPYFIEERRLLASQEGAIALFDRDKEVAEMEINLITRMNYIPKSSKLFNVPKRPMSPTDSISMYNINRINEVMKLYSEGVSRYNALKQGNLNGR